MAALDTLKCIKRVFEERKKELYSNSSNSRVYTENQYIEQVLNIIKSFEKIVFEKPYKIYLESMPKVPIAIDSNNYLATEIDNCIFISTNNLSSHEIKDLEEALIRLTEEKVIKKTIIFIPQKVEFCSAKLCLEEDGDD